MDKSTIQTLIDKVIGKKGLIRVPSWWMRKVLMQIVDWIQEGDDANNERIEKVKNETNEKINAFGSNIDYLRNLSLPYILVSGTGVVNINRSDINFSDANNKLISITGPISFGRSNFTDNKQLKSIVIHELDFRLQDKSMEGMFRRCTSLVSLVLTELYTYAVTNMSYMFSSCSSLTSLDLSSFNTSSVLNMEGMFG